ncbi:hypothetical protein [Methanolobus halotolerans]|uniref:Uncharacterized protein n=1 Tax=Methanolobus halotolerans TaxID=2052935 RepID=A0A4E0QXC5_9EURY|nr:hypothetical protein [Methanolobus halotolerans]TGC07412.1 hypothetical protein CUN85_11445 [Methanolobus halotolerans]
MTFTPVSRLCIYCKEKIYITEPVDRVTCTRCGEVIKVVIGRTVRLSRIPVDLSEKASNLPISVRTQGSGKIVSSKQEKIEHTQKTNISNTKKRG